jgi:hypothetical protein
MDSLLKFFPTFKEELIPIFFKLSIKQKKKELYQTHSIKPVLL